MAQICFVWQVSLPECFDLTHFTGSLLLGSQRRRVFILMNNTFISPLEAPDNALIAADSAPPHPLFFPQQIKSRHLLMVIN